MLDLDLTGGDYLWLLALTNPIEDLASDAGTLLMKTFGSVSYRIVDNKLYFVEECFKRIRSVNPIETLHGVDEVVEVGEQEDDGAAAAPRKTISAGSADIVSDGDEAENAMALRKVQRCVRILGLYVQRLQEQHPISYRPEYFPHYLGG